MWLSVMFSVGVRELVCVCVFAFVPLVGCVCVLVLVRAPVEAPLRSPRGRAACASEGRRGCEVAGQLVLVCL